ncbi:MAG: hypothetical protein GXO78_09560 [Calditrichaeota bacterium]|nr:hypothetical protein [Calditrichota bacterium]
MGWGSWLVLFGLGISGLMGLDAGPCPFSESALQFEGSPLEQARCLLQPVQRYGRLGAPLQKLPEPLESRIGRRVTLSVEQFRRYLNARGISEAELGGSLDAPLCRADDNHPAAPTAWYFIIHDTSTPNYGAQEFPAQINDEEWEHNDLERWNQGNRSRAHVFINRLGQSLTAVDFATPWRATKFELQRLGRRGKGLCLHVELIQPRRSDPAGPPGNDALAPEPGFTVPQLKRLALVYLAASIRKGSWLIPGYHAAIDAGIPGAHDDPQNFDLHLWAQLLDALVQEVETAKSSSPIVPGRETFGDVLLDRNGLGMDGCASQLPFDRENVFCPENQKTIEKRGSGIQEIADDTGFIAVAKGGEKLVIRHIFSPMWDGFWLICKKQVRKGKIEVPVV